MNVVVATGDDVPVWPSHRGDARRQASGAPVSVSKSVQSCSTLDSMHESGRDTVALTCGVRRGRVGSRHVSVPGTGLTDRFVHVPSETWLGAWHRTGAG